MYLNVYMYSYICAHVNMHIIWYMIDLNVYIYSDIHTHILLCVIWHIRPKKELQNFQHDTTYMISDISCMKKHMINMTKYTINMIYEIWYDIWGQEANEWNTKPSMWCNTKPSMWCTICDDVYLTHQASQRKNYEIQYDLNPNLQNVIVIDCVVEVCVCLYVHTLVRCVCVFHARGMAA